MISWYSYNVNGRRGEENEIKQYEISENNIIFHHQWDIGMDLFPILGIANKYYEK